VTTSWSIPNSPPGGPQARRSLWAVLFCAVPQYPCLVSSLEHSDERLRLARTYAAMTDDELEHLAGNPESLTETAREALEDELDRRDLELPDSPEPHRELDLRTLVTIRQFRDLPEALLAKGSLESAGIECFLRDENLVRLDWFISNFVGGVKLCVMAEDASKAKALLDQPILEGLYVHGVGLYEQPRCPKCNSLDVTYQELDPAAYLSMAVNVPIPFHRDGWRCRACAAEWEDDESTGIPEPS
jgi:Putative prokaryotic signal transducing protein